MEEKNNKRFSFTNEEVVEKKEETTTPTNKISKFYFSFRLRIILLVTGILLLFTVASIMIISSLRNNEVLKVNYNESSKVLYKTCYQDNSCLPENRTYDKEKIGLINTNFNYEVVFEEDVDYKLSYYVVLINRIYDPFDDNKIYYEDENTLIDTTPIKGDSNHAIAEVKVDIDYQKYRVFVDEYLEKYKISADSTVDVILYVNDGKETRNVSRVSIPLTEEKVEIHTDSLSKEKRIYYHKLGEWTSTNTILVILGSVLIVLSLLLLSYLTRLVSKITVKKSKYQQVLQSILNEYNHFIVNSDGDYKIDNNKRIVKVSSFEELLDARGILNKPIIYSKINNIKSEFIIEDSDIIYRYVLKEADMEE